MNYKKFKAYPVFNKKRKLWNVHAIMPTGIILPIGCYDGGICILDEFASKDEAIEWIKDRNKNLELINKPN